MLAHVLAIGVGLPAWLAVSLVTLAAAGVTFAVADRPRDGRRRALSDYHGKVAGPAAVTADAGARARADPRTLLRCLFRMPTRDDLRNVAIIAHVDHGKTTLVDALLRQAGALGRAKGEGTDND